MPFAPSDLSGLQVWLKADAGLGGLSDGDAISTWADQSGGGHDFTGSGSTRPLYKTGIQNSLPAVRFDGSDDILHGGNLSALWPSAATIFIVYNRDLTGGSFTLFYTKASDDSWWRYDTGLSYNGVFRSARLEALPRIAAPSGGACRQVCIKSSATNWQMYADGALCGTQTAAFDAGTLTELGAGPTANGARFFKGDVFEVIIYDSALSDGDRQSVEAYLASKWAIDRSADSGTPSSISGLKLWLKADKISGKSDGDTVNYWPDASGNARDWTCKNSTSGTWPLYKTNIQNGLPSVRFDGSDDVLWAPGNPAEVDFPSACHTFIVFAPLSDTTYTVLWNVNNTDTWRFSDNNSYWGFSKVTRLSGAAYGLPSAAPTQVDIKSSGAGYRVYVKGTAGTSQSADYPSASGFVNPWTMGVDQVAFHGDVFEVLMYDTALSDADRAAVENYLMVKYGFGPRILTIGRAAETDTAGTLTPVKAGQAVNRTAETDTAAAVTLVHRRLAGQTAETDTAHAFAVVKGYRIAVAQTAETDTAAAWTHSRTRAFATAAETDTARTVSSGEQHALTQAAESDTAAAITPGHSYAVAQTTETNTASAFTARFPNTVVRQVAETAAVGAVTPLHQPHGPGSGGSSGGASDFWIVEVIP